MNPTDFVPTTNGLEILRYLETLMEHRGGSIMLEEEDSAPLPVVFMRVEAGKPLLVDLSSAREVVARVRNGEPFRLVGQSGNKLLRTDLLVATSCREHQGRVECEVEFPQVLHVLQRRDSFRATLRKDLHCQVLLEDAEAKREYQGQLRDLSMGGCSVELPLRLAQNVNPNQNFTVTLAFPNGRRLSIVATLRRVMPQTEQGLMVAGFSFDEPTPEQSRELWFFVREIEREWGRSAERGDSQLAPSPLFVAAENGPVDEARPEREYVTPMAGRLAACADFLALQIQSLRTGGTIDSQQLSRQAERLLRLLDQDREALLFATVCLSEENLLIRHGLGVAVRLVDLLDKSVTPTQRKSLAACAMIHELGRSLLPAELAWDEELEADEAAQSHRHVELLLDRLKDCSWLDADVLSSVVARANERLDGSGYPQQLRDDELDDLARAMAVVDEIDLMSRRRPGAAPRSITLSYAHLLRRPGKYDPIFVKRYVEHFGRLPVGTLLRFESGQLAWVLGLDEALRPARVQLATEPGPPRAEHLGEVVSGGDLRELGKVAEVLPVE